MCNALDYATLAARRTCMMMSRVSGSDVRPPGGPPEDAKGLLRELGLVYRGCGRSLAPPDRPLPVGSVIGMPDDMTLNRPLVGSPSCAARLLADDGEAERALTSSTAGCRAGRGCAALVTVGVEGPSASAAALLSAAASTTWGAPSVLRAAAAGVPCV